MKLRIFAIVVAFAGSGLPAAALQTPASAKSISLQQLQKYASDQKECGAAIKSKRVVTRAVRKECLGEPVKSGFDCPRPLADVVTFFSGQSQYLMTVGHKPEKISEPSQSQIPYLCKNGTLKGAPAA